METQEPIYIANATARDMDRAHERQEKTNNHLKQETPVNHGDGQTCPEEPTKPR